MHMGHPVLLTANRWQELSDLSGGRTRYRTIDRFSGLLVPLVMALYGEPTRRGFESVAAGLKQWVESGDRHRLAEREDAAQGVAAATDPELDATGRTATPLSPAVEGGTSG
jgi:hypothetical protein